MANTTTTTNNPGVLEQQKIPRPKRIILVRHGESQANVDEKVYGKISDHKIESTETGMDQAKKAGKEIQDVVSEKGKSSDWNVYFYVSPYERTRATLKGIGEAFARNRVLGVKEECRVREQDFGNFQDYEKMKQIKETRKRYGRFFFRFPEGESGADVYDRVSSFIESLWMDIDMNRFPPHSGNLNLIIVSHGLSIRIFLMRWFKWTVEQFEQLKSPKNGEYRVMQLGYDGEYSLAIHHNEEQLKAWGLSDEMIEDQKHGAHGPVAVRGLSKKKLLYCNSFFHRLAEPDDAAKGDEEAKNVQAI